MYIKLNATKLISMRTTERFALRLRPQSNLVAEKVFQICLQMCFTTVVVVIIIIIIALYLYVAEYV